MNIDGSSSALSAGQLGDYICEQGENDYEPNVGRINGTIEQKDFRSAVKEMYTVASGSKGSKVVHHGWISVDKGFRPTPDQWDDMVREVAKDYGYDGLPYAWKEHMKGGQPHIHFVVQRYDPMKGKLRSDSFVKYKNIGLRDRLERKYGLTKTPTFNKKAPEIQKKATKTWNDTRTEKEPAKAFTTGMKDQGFILTRNFHSRNPFQLVDNETGRSYSLFRMLKDFKEKVFIPKSEVYERMEGASLPKQRPVIKGIRDRIDKEQRETTVKQQFRENTEATKAQEPKVRKSFSENMAARREEARKRNKDQGFEHE